MTSSATRWTRAAGAVLSAAALAGCSAGAPVARHSASTPPTGAAPTPATTQDVDRLGVGEGTGPGTVDVVAPPPVGTQLTVRLTCVGPGRVRVLDRSGGLILATQGCARGVVYSSAWRSTAHDGTTVAVVVAPATHWAVDVWRGRPPTTIAPAPTA